MQMPFPKVLVSNVAVAAVLTMVEQKLLHIAGAVTDMHVQTCSTEEMRHLQSQDPIIGPVYNTVRDGRQPSPDELSVLGKESKWLLQQLNCLCLRNGLLWRKDLEHENAFQLILPYLLHDEVLKDLHEGAVGGHLGEGKMLEKLKERFYWPGCSGRVVQRMY